MQQTRTRYGLDFGSRDAIFAKKKTDITEDDRQAQPLAEMALVYRAVSTQKRLAYYQTKRGRETRLPVSAFSVKKSSRT